MTTSKKVLRIICFIIILAMTLYEAYSLIYTIVYNIYNGYHLAMGSFGIELIRFVSLVILLFSILRQKDNWRMLAFIGTMVVSLAFIAKILLNVWRGKFLLQDNLGYLVAESALALATLLLIIAIKRSNILLVVLILVCTGVAVFISPYYIFANLPIIVVGIIMNGVSRESGNIYIY